MKKYATDYWHYAKIQNPRTKLVDVIAMHNMDTLNMYMHTRKQKEDAMPC